MMNDPESGINWPAIAAAAGVVVVVGGGTRYWLHRKHEMPRPGGETQAVPPAAAAPDNVVQHPLAGTDAAASAPLPALADSDAALKQSLGEAVGAASVNEFLVQESIIR